MARYTTTSRTIPKTINTGPEAMVRVFAPSRPGGTESTKRIPFLVLASALAMLLLEGCASGGSARRPLGQQPALQCPVGYTVTCEVRKTGRIHHGSFGKNYDSCSCVPNSSRPQTSPVIPSL